MASTKQLSLPRLRSIAVSGHWIDQGRGWRITLGGCGDSGRDSPTRSFLPQSGHHFLGYHIDAFPKVWSCRIERQTVNMNGRRKLVGQVAKRMDQINSQLVDDGDQQLHRVLEAVDPLFELFDALICDALARWRSGSAFGHRTWGNGKGCARLVCSFRRQRRLIVCAVGIEIRKHGGVSSYRQLEARLGNLCLRRVVELFFVTFGDLANPLSLARDRQEIPDRCSRPFTRRHDLHHDGPKQVVADAYRMV